MSGRFGCLAPWQYLKMRQNGFTRRFYPVQGPSKYQKETP